VIRTFKCRLTTGEPTTFSVTIVAGMHPMFITDVGWFWRDKRTEDTDMANLAALGGIDLRSIDFDHVVEERS
jgi:hypothetical protein